MLSQDDEIRSIRDLINSAVLDTSVKGGLRWSFGKASAGKYEVVGVWHTIAKTYYISPSMRLKVRHADRFDFRTCVGEASREITLKLKGVASKFLVSPAFNQSKALVSCIGIVIFSHLLRIMPSRRVIFLYLRGSSFYFNCEANFIFNLSRIVFIKKKKK